MLDVSISINEKKLLAYLIAFELMLFASFLVDSFLLPNFHLDMFNLNDESTLASWFSSLQYFCIALIFLQHTQQNKTASVSPFLFLIASLGFFFLSIDEAVTIHEKLNHQLKHIEFLPSFKGHNGIWIYLYLALLLPLIIIMYKPLVQLWKAYRHPTIIMAIGFAILVFGGVLLEVIGYEYLNADINYIYYVLEVAFEEFFEMAGVSIILYGALTTLRTRPVIATNPQFVVT